MNKPDLAAVVWIDGDPLMEAIASAVWEHCRTEGTSLVADDPRNIAAVAATAARAAVRAETLRDAEEICDEAGAVYTSKALNGEATGAYELMERFRRKAEEAETATPAVLSPPTDRAAALREAAEVAESFDIDASPQAVAAELRRLAVEAHGTGTQQPTPCGPFSVCEDGGEPCANHEREQAHADGEHELCEPECGAGAQQQPDIGARAEEPPTEEQMVRDHLTTLHLIGEQLTRVESWMWAHLADVRDAQAATAAPVAQQPAALRAELKPWQLLADQPDEPLPQTERVIGGRRLATTEQQAAAADGEETQRCAHTDIVYGRCVLPIPHDGECVHEHQPRCAMPSPDGQHSCVLPPNHEWLHADKHLAEVMPNGNRVVWETPIAEPPSA